MDAKIECELNQLRWDHEREIRVLRTMIADLEKQVARLGTTCFLSKKEAPPAPKPGDVRWRPQEGYKVGECYEYFRSIGGWHVGERKVDRRKEKP